MSSLEFVKRHEWKILVLLLIAAAGMDTSAQDLEQTTLQDLLNVRITTASLTSEGIGDAAARVQVVTNAQIRRRGYRSVADVLKDLVDFKVDLAGDQD